MIPDVATQSALNQVANSIDPLLEMCPVCKTADLRMEFKVEWRPMTEACRVFGGVTPAEIRASGTLVDSFGRVKCGVPYVTCMSCGLHADATDAPARRTGDGR